MNKAIKIDDELSVIVDENAEIKKDDWRYYKMTTFGKPPFESISKDNTLDKRFCKKIIATIGSKTLEGVPRLEDEKMTREAFINKWLGTGYAYDEQRIGLMRDDLDKVINYHVPKLNDNAIICGCGNCTAEYQHKSDCAVHNMPAMPNGKCDCKLNDETMENNPLQELKTWAEGEVAKCLKTYFAMDKTKNLTHQYIGEHTAFSLVVDKINELENELVKLNDEGEDVEKLAEKYTKGINECYVDELQDYFILGYTAALQNKAKCYTRSNVLDAYNKGAEDCANVLREHNGNNPRLKDGTTILGHKRAEYINSLKPPTESINNETINRR